MSRLWFISFSSVVGINRIGRCTARVVIVILDAVILVNLGVGIFLSSVITSCAGLELVNHPSCFTSLLFFQKKSCNKNSCNKT